MRHTRLICLTWKQFLIDWLEKFSPSNTNFPPHTFALCIRDTNVLRFESLGKQFWIYRVLCSWGFAFNWWKSRCLKEFFWGVEISETFVFWKAKLTTALLEIIKNWTNKNPKPQKTENRFAFKKVSSNREIPTSPLGSIVQNLFFR